MSKIAIITDTDSSLPKDIADQYNIIQVPISINFDEDLSGTDLTINNEQLFSHVDKTGKLPTTSAPSPALFKQYFEQILAAEVPDTILCFTVSASMSRTYQSATEAAKELSNHDIRVIDSETLSMEQGYMAIAAAKAAKIGATIDDITQSAFASRDNTILYGALSTLRYLSMSGRVSHVAAGMAGMLNIKPILSVQNGKLDMLEKIRTRKKSWTRMIELVQEDLNNRTIQEVCILHVNAAQPAQEFEKMVRNALVCPNEIPAIEVNPGLSVHTGAGLVGLCIVMKH